MTAIGLIGLGNMGMPMAKILIDAGYDVLGYRRGDASDFEALGGRAMTSPRAVAEETDIIVCCIPSDAALEEIVSGPEGIASADCTGKILAELSTLTPEVKAAQAAAMSGQGGLMLDGAISGLSPMVVARTAVYMLSGEEAAYEKLRPVFDALTGKHFYMGDFGAAMKTKLCANMLVAANIASTAETLAFGALMGLDQEKLVEALRDGAGGSIQFMARAGRMARGEWDNVLASTALLAKDIRMIEKTGTELGAPMPILKNVRPFYETAIEDGYGDVDVAAVYAAFAKAAGLPIAEPKGKKKS
ncbi:MAG: NAD(P)-dependent oxidoreductase [Maritimibacter sp.]|jgi:putative dehydrogenase|uniref:NAD(P)-dependent oxidoreductase n=1 Tax=Maritimibacter sp. TaxID=2003363 RepID=UPI001D912554|nr:NAD(P)-dependent oxidoreductase [Maritimibacter sp.]MBL6430251.1 NAD(P)-dependent oxidoreductase [Maritimibacter sp.]